MFPITQTANRPTTNPLATRLICLEKRGSAASVGRRAVVARVVTSDAPPSPPYLVERLHEVGRRREHLVGDQLAALGDIDRHRPLVRVTVLVDGEVAEHAVRDLDTEQMLGDVAPRAVGRLD